MSISKDQLFKLLTQIPRGRVTTYKLLAQTLNTSAYRAIGQILSTNPNAPTIPCHRVVKSNGELGGYAGSTENNKKKKLLQSEGLIIKNNKIANFSQVIFSF